MVAVYVFDPETNSVVSKAAKTDLGRVVAKDGSLLPTPAMDIIPVTEFYDHEAVSELVPSGGQGCQVHVECLHCGFETVYGVYALFGQRNGYDEPRSRCTECGLNVWKEVDRQWSSCDWSGYFEWAESPNKSRVE